MNVLFVIKTLALPGGGAERILSVISRAIADRGHDVTVLTLDGSPAEDFYPFSENVGRLHLGIRETPGRSRPLDLARRVGGLRRILRESSPHVGVGFMHSAYVPLALAAAGTGIPVIASERTSYPHYRSRWIEWQMVRLALPFMKQITVNSEGVRRGYPEAAARHMLVIPNPVSPALQMRTPIHAKGCILLSVGGLRPEKDHQTLINAFAAVASSQPGWRLRIVGEGPLRPSLQSQIDRLGLTARVELAGACLDVEREYCAADLFVLPSRYEAFPNCVAEALAHGLAVIGFADCPGTNELIVDGVNGLLVSGGDRSAALARALNELMGSKRERARLAKQAPASAACFALSGIVDQWEALFARVVTH